MFYITMCITLRTLTTTLFLRKQILAPPMICWSYQSVNQSRFLT